MKKNQEYKNAALAALRGKWAYAVVFVILTGIIASVVVAPSSVSGLVQSTTISLILYALYAVMYIFVMIPLSVGIVTTFLRVLRTGEPAKVDMAIDEALDGYWHKIVTVLLSSIFQALFSLLLIVPGIIKAYAYSMVPFILKDNPELSARETLRLSEKMMKGHKFELFCLQISFIGWAILSILTLFIGLLWLEPYYQTSIAAFYEDVKSENLR